MRKRDALAFWARLEDNLFSLCEQLRAGEYRHDSYEHFYIHDLKRRYISAATVKDRIIHQAVTQVIEPLFERSFIFDSYAGRKGKGVHAAVCRLEKFFCEATKNYHQAAYALKCDVRKFYDSVRHDVLMDAILKNMRDERLSRLFRLIIKSYSALETSSCGLPLGNVASQLFTNIYLNDFDHFVKEKLRMRWYIRFCDDFVIVHREREVLEEIVPKLQKYLLEQRALKLHPNKVQIRKISHGIDFIGCVFTAALSRNTDKDKEKNFSQNTAFDALAAEWHLSKGKIQTITAILFRGIKTRFKS